LYAGISGLAFVSWVINEWDGEAQSVSDHDDVLDVIVQTLDQAPDQLHFDFIVGLAGIGQYVITLGPQPKTNAVMDRIISELARRAVSTGDGLAWETPDAWMP